MVERKGKEWGMGGGERRVGCVYGGETIKVDLNEWE